MIEEYDDFNAAHERAKHLNRIEGAGKYCVLGDEEDKSWTVQLTRDVFKQAARCLLRSRETLH